MNLAILLAVSLLPLSAPPELASEVSMHTLSNGMKVIVQEDHDIPNVAMHLFFQIGSRNEGPGTTGLSHFFEHMMFNGAKKYGPKQFDTEMEKRGGHNNAYTGRDLTAYTDWFPRDALELMMDMEADRIKDLAFDPKLIESERGVVISERKLAVDNSNFGQLYEQLNATAYAAHSYGWPIIGWASDIESWTMDDLKAHFRAGYAPNNCVVVVVGDVAAAEVLALAKKYFEPIPGREPPQAVRTKEPEQRGERRVEVRRTAQLPMQLLSYHVPRADDADHAPLQVLGAVLAEGRGSRLYRRLVDRDQLALLVTQFQEVSLDPGQLIIQIQPRSGVEPAATEKALYEELDQLSSQEISAQELQRAKNQLLADLYRELSTIEGKANLLARYEIFFGDSQRLSTAAAELEKVSSGDVMNVAKKYLTAKNRTVATLIPEKEEEAR